LVGQGYGMCTSEKPGLRMAFFTLVHGPLPVHTDMARQERGAGTLEDIHDIHALTHKVMLEHAVRAGVGFHALGRGETKLTAGGLIAQVVVDDNGDIGVGPGRVNKMQQSDAEGVAVADRTDNFLFPGQGDPKPAGDGVHPAMGAGESVAFPGGEGLTPGASDGGSPDNVATPRFSSSMAWITTL
jgi:hypothetical protein